MKYKLIFDDVFIIEKGTCPCAPPFYVETVKEWESVDGNKCFQSPFFFLYLEKVGREGESSAPSSPTAPIPRNGGQLLDVIPGCPV